MFGQLRDRVSGLAMLLVMGSWVACGPQDPSEEPSAEQAVGTSVASLYKHCAYGGWRVNLQPGRYNRAALVALGARDNDASSLKLNAGFEAVLYDADNFAGASVTTTGEVSCLTTRAFNDRLSSIEIRSVASGAGGSTSGTGGTTSSGGAGGSAASGGASGADGGMGSGASAGSGGSSADPYAEARARCVDRTNALRSSKGLKAIPRYAKAEPCVDGQAKSDSETGKAHGSFAACLNEVSGWRGGAQNECPGWGSVESTLTGCIDAMWAEGPGGGHYENMVGGSTKMACGFYTTPTGKVWMVQDFWTD